MFGYLNECKFIGHLGADPESRRTQNGERAVNFRIAVSENWKDKATGEKKSRTEWVSVVIWNQHIGKIASDFLHKGSRVYVCGRMQTRKWQDQNGNDRYTAEVVLPQFGGDLQILDTKSDKQETQSAVQARSAGQNEYHKQSGSFAGEAVSF